MIETKLYTIEEFEQILADPANSDRLLELIDGEIVEKMPTEEHAILTGNIHTPLNMHVKKNKLGRALVEARHSTPNDNKNDRLPDISFNAGNRPVVKKGSIPQMPDFAIEIKSPDDSYPELRAKAEHYLKNGTQLAWLVYPARQEVEQFTKNENGIIQRQTFTIEDTLSADPVVPGFTIAMKDIFDLS